MTISEKIKALAESTATDEDRLQVLIHLTAELAQKIEPTKADISRTVISATEVAIATLERVYVEAERNILAGNSVSGAHELAIRDELCRLRAELAEASSATG